MSPHRFRVTPSHKTKYRVGNWPSLGRAKSCAIED